MSCYICLQDETKKNPFCKTLICKCKGTNKIHESCLEEVKAKCGNRCTICNSIYKITKTPIINYDDREIKTKVVIPIPERTVPERTVPERTVPERTVPERTVPERTVPGYFSGTVLSTYKPPIKVKRVMLNEIYKCNVFEEERKCTIM